MHTPNRHHHEVARIRRKIEALERELERLRQQSDLDDPAAWWKDGHQSHPPGKDAGWWRDGPDKP